MLSLAELNALDQNAFVEHLGWIFEHSPWVAQQAWLRRPFASLEELHQSMVQAIKQAPTAQQLALIRAHPDLGSRAKMAQASVMEQQGAGLDSLTPGEYQLLATLNAQYTQRFGFPFIFAVKGKNKHDVLASMQERLQHGAQQEFDTALQHIYRIGWFRLNDAVG